MISPTYHSVIATLSERSAFICIYPGTDGYVSGKGVSIDHEQMMNFFGSFEAWVAHVLYTCFCQMGGS